VVLTATINKAKTIPDDMIDVMTAGLDTRVSGGCVLVGGLPILIVVCFGIFPVLGGGVRPPVSLVAYFKSCIVLSSNNGKKRQDEKQQDKTR
jgi:hypothetical protein